jgi:hypothetical protein
MSDQPATGYAVYEKVAADIGRNIALSFIGVGIIWLIARFWLGAAKVLFWVAAAVTALGVAHFLFVLLAGTITWMTGRPGSRERWLWAATAARLVEQILLLIALWLAARSVGYLSSA